jgi:hypothetical protein
MSDYEVTLVNDSMQEFYVRFYGPEESKPFILLVDSLSHAHIFPHKHPLRVASGKSMSSYQINTRSSHQASDS